MNVWYIIKIEIIELSRRENYEIIELSSHAESSYSYFNSPTGWVENVVTDQRLGGGTTFEIRDSGRLIGALKAIKA